MDLPINITIYLDSTNALSNATHDAGMYTNKTKHIRVHFLSVFEQIKCDNTITYKYIPGVDQPADIFTKPLDRQRFERLRTALGVL